MTDDQNTNVQPGTSADRGLGEDIKAKVRYLMDVVACMDRRIDLELAQLDQSAAEDDLKDFIRQDTLARHSARREAYSAILEELQGQHSGRTVAA